MAAARHVTLPNPCRSKLMRSGNYRSVSAKPLPMPDGATPYRNQIHHILCEHAIQDRQPDGDRDDSKKKFITDCLCLISWDINDASNLIGLPMKSAYTRGRVNRPVNTPCHNVDHNTADGYTQECKKWLHTNVWNKIIDKRKTHEANADNIKAQLETCTRTFEAVLASRGARRGGTRVCWEERLTRHKWYYPFSMAARPTERSPGGRELPNVLKMIR